jgi:hypothetical protein
VLTSTAVLVPHLVQPSAGVLYEQVVERGDESGHAGDDHGPHGVKPSPSTAGWVRIPA